MEQLGVVTHEETVSAVNPFGVEMDGPLQNHATVAKHAPKRVDPTDTNGFGGIHSGG